MTNAAHEPLAALPLAGSPLAGLYRIAGGTAVVLAVMFLAVTEGQAVDPAGGTPANPLWAIPLDGLTATRDHPIFSPTRRPPPPVVALVEAPLVKAPPPPAEPDHPLLTLVGTIVGGPTGIAVFLDPATQNVIRLQTGQDFGGWVLRSVRARQTSFEKDIRTAIVSLPPRDAPPASEPPAPAGPNATATVDEAVERRGRVAVSPQLRRSAR